MTNPSVQTSTTSTTIGVVSILLPCVVIGHFLWKLLTPAHEFPMRTEQVMTMVFDFGMLLSLVSLRRAIPAPLFWVALAAGIGLFALRLSHDGWWTGHLTYSLPLR
jgi:hypothetical protein